ncbi:hypothetical protein ACO2JO_14460 [Leptospira interrogans]
MKQPKRKVSPVQRHQLIQIFLHMGDKDAQAACMEAGVGKNYAEQQARETFAYQKKRFAGSGHIGRRVDHSDPRWKWAIERGPVGAA